MNLNLSLGEALAKAGIKGTKTLGQIEREIEKEVAKKTPPQEPQGQSKIGSAEEGATLKRGNKDGNPFTRLWLGERSKKFLLHILHAFIPFQKAGFIYSWAEDQEKKCCICRRNMKTWKESIPKEKEDEIKRKTSNLSIDSLETPPEAIETAIGTAKSRTVFCHKCWIGFIRWVKTYNDPEIKKIKEKRNAQ